MGVENHPRRTAVRGWAVVPPPRSVRIWVKSDCSARDSFLLPCFGACGAGWRGWGLGLRAPGGPGSHLAGREWPELSGVVAVARSGVRSPFLGLRSPSQGSERTPEGLVTFRGSPARGSHHPPGGLVPFPRVRSPSRGSCPPPGGQVSPGGQVPSGRQVPLLGVRSPFRGSPFLGFGFPSSGPSPSRLSGPVPEGQIPLPGV